MAAHPNRPDRAKCPWGSFRARRRPVRGGMVSSPGRTIRSKHRMACRNCAGYHGGSLDDGDQGADRCPSQRPAGFGDLVRITGHGEGQDRRSGPIAQCCESRIPASHGFLLGGPRRRCGSGIPPTELRHHTCHIGHRTSFGARASARQSHVDCAAHSRLLAVVAAHAVDAAAAPPSHLRLVLLCRAVVEAMALAAR